jgi:hypothetical protein
MTISRRSFLKVGAMAGLSVPLIGSTELGAATGLNPATGSKLPGAGRRDPLSQLNKADFERQTKSRFGIRSAQAGATHLKLIQVGNLPPSGKGEAFSLVFRGSSKRPMRQDTYSIRHAALGSFSLLLVPVGQAKSAGRYYEAVINRLS